MLGNSNGGVFATGTAASTTTAIVSDSIISVGSQGVGALVSSPGAFAQAFVTRCTIEGTSFAAVRSQVSTIGAFAVVTVSSSMITKNDTGWFQSGAGSMIKSLGNNHIQDNTNAPTGTLTPAPLQKRIEKNGNTAWRRGDSPPGRAARDTRWAGSGICWADVQEIDSAE
jgi:hypothetical protein